LNLLGRTISGLPDAFNLEELGRFEAFLEAFSQLGFLRDLEDWLDGGLSMLGASLLRA